MTRFFVPPEQILDGMATLDVEDAHHLRVVLKATPGASIAILDGTGREYPGVLDSLGKTKATVQLGASTEPSTEPRTKITVAQALPKMAEKMEQVLQRGTEIGAAAFWAFQSERSLPHLTGERHEKRLIRWRAIVKTAAEQSHRALLPEVRANQEFADVIASADHFDIALLADANESQITLRQTLSALFSLPNSLLIIIGPESGFSPSEVAAARRSGVHSVSLAPRILRTETAALVMASQILYALE